MFQGTSAAGHQKKFLTVKTMPKQQGLSHEVPNMRKMVIYKE